MNYLLSAHAREELDRRQIALALLEDVLSHPEQKVPGHEGIRCYQSRVTLGEKQYLLRVMVNETTDPLDRGHRLSNKQAGEILEHNMKVTYDPEVDVLRVLFGSGPVEESDEDKPGVIIDYDKAGNIIGLEILNASRRVENPRAVEYAVTS